MKQGNKVNISYQIGDKVSNVKGMVIHIGKKDLILNAHGVDGNFNDIGNRFSIVRIPMMSITGVKQAKFDKDVSKKLTNESQFYLDLMNPRVKVFGDEGIFDALTLKVVEDVKHLSKSLTLTRYPHSLRVNSLVLKGLHYKETKFLKHWDGVKSLTTGDLIKVMSDLYISSYPVTHSSEDVTKENVLTYKINGDTIDIYHEYSVTANRPLKLETSQSVYYRMYSDISKMAQLIDYNKDFLRGIKI